MELIADIFLVAGALGASVYCFVLARRLKRFNDLERGVGGAVAVMSSQVDDMTKTLADARAASSQSSEALELLTKRAEAVSKKLELMLASLHDVPEGADPLKPDEQNKDPDTGNVPKTPDDIPKGPMFVRHDRNKKNSGYKNGTQ